MSQQSQSSKAVVLPTAPIKPTSQNPRKLILYSLPKIGKTTFAAQLPNSLLIDLEKGSKFVEAVKVEVESLSELADIGRAIKEAGKPYKYIIIDTISKLEDWCEWDATEEYMNSVMGQSFNRDRNGNIIAKPAWESVLSLPNGAGYHWLRLNFKKWLASIFTLAEHVIMIAHLKDKMINKAGKEVSAKEIDLVGKLKLIASADADAIGYMYRDEGKDGVSRLRISFNAGDTILCGSRVQHLKGVDIDADWNKIFTDL